LAFAKNESDSAPLPEPVNQLPAFEFAVNEKVL
jgi:hypothetical protein